jgi:N-methylhydantoinase B
MSGLVDADPITTEVVRHGLMSCAEQMKRTVIRTSFSPVIYETLDFAVAIYDNQMRMLAQAPTLPFFMGVLSMAVEAAIESVGGEDAVRPGDVLLYNVPYETGSHPPDAAVAMPIFASDGQTRLGYAAIMAHWLDIGAKDPYCTDTVDVYQEGTKFPGVRLYSAGERNEDIFKIIRANSRMPRMVVGDINAQIASLQMGARAVADLAERHGEAPFHLAVERMLDHGELMVRDYIARIPDGRYVAEGMMDDNGVDDTPLPFEIAVEVEGSTVRVDFSNAPDAQPTPINAVLPATISCARVALSMVAAAGEPPNEGHFRPIEVITRPGSLFHPLPPSPCFLGWPVVQSFDVVFDALTKAMPGTAPAWSGGDILAMVWWGERENTGEAWIDGAPHPVGQGASASGDGANALMHSSESATRLTPVEVWETRNPWVVERVELAQDSGGVGQFRGGMGLDVVIRATEAAWLTSVVERTRTGAPGVDGGGRARPNGVTLTHADGSTRQLSKATRVPVPKGATVEVRTGGGGGHGPPAERDPDAVLADLADGYISMSEAERCYPHALGRRD